MTNIGTKFILAQRFVFDPNSNSLVDQHSDSEVIRLGSNESRILLMLSERPNEVITRQQLHEYVWQDQGFQVDDSSLTQAISTLRKMLKDSTKSPQFVKTVPKRGYQLISSVERSAPSASGDEISEPTDVAAPQLEQPEATDTESVVQIEIRDDNESTPPTPSDTPLTKKKPSKLLWVAAFLAILVPVLTFFGTQEKPSTFVTISEVSGIPVRMPENHPSMAQSLPNIEQCIEHYAARHEGDLSPVQVIATGGQNGQIILNYIHSINYSSENVTLRIFSTKPDFAQVCN
ncbi:transcriptional regulator [Vibrio penaeicida]|uniref:Cholera toxin homolog transcriptional activator n=1 Tax=Vibrio penaeicida TaxID=104609 RepID=A0AAV5NL59_9VIBR|nr:transcriptional regulator [Vibrio penaeicida]RTZ21354.1 transcriptional regulator [Vibrio penaeicida]GLQ71380.1 cholera toxin homolog transcriptional activator [Vibrio penaeicida]